MHTNLLHWVVDYHSFETLNLIVRKKTIGICIFTKNKTIEFHSSYIVRPLGIISLTVGVLISHWLSVLVENKLQSYQFSYLVLRHIQILKIVEICQKWREYTTELIGVETKLLHPHKIPKKQWNRVNDLFQGPHLQFFFKKAIFQGLWQCALHLDI